MIKSKLKAFADGIENNKAKVLGAVGGVGSGAMVTLASSLAFADGETSSALVSAGDFTTLTSTITANAQTMIPVGLTILGIMVAIGLIPRIIYKFL